MAKCHLAEYEVKVLHKRPGSNHWYADTVWYAAYGEKDLGNIIRRQYVGWGFTDIMFQTLNMCSAVPVHTKGRNIF